MQLAAFALVYLSVLNASECGTVQMFSPQSQKPLEYDVCFDPIKHVHVGRLMVWALYFLSSNQSYRLWTWLLHNVTAKLQQILGGKKHISTVVCFLVRGKQDFQNYAGWVYVKITENTTCTQGWLPAFLRAFAQLRWPPKRSNKCSHNKTKHTTSDCINLWPPTRCAKFNCRVNQCLCISGTMITGRTSVITPGKVKGYNLNAASGSPRNAAA